MKTVNAEIKYIQKFKNLSGFVSDYLLSDDFSFLNLSKYTVLPGFCDVHVHFREPGFSYKETIYSGSMAALRGGYTSVCTMPNLKPAPDSKENLDVQLNLIKDNAKVNIYPYGTITIGQAGKELSKMEEMAEYAAGFSDDGRGVQDEELMLLAMKKAKELNKIIVAHCEDNNLLFGGYIHDGEYARKNGHKGICSESEYGQIKRDLELVKKTNCSYHVCHISTKESVELIRQAKKDGLDVTCETAPHYLVLDDGDLKEDGRFKMNPPLRSREDKVALIEGIKDGTIDMIATDHAPHSKEEKEKGLEKSAFGIVGLETAFPVLYSKLVKNNIITMEKLIMLLCENPRKRFNIPLKNDFSVWDLEKEFIVDSKEFLSKGKATPFEGEKLFGECVSVVIDGKEEYKTNN